MITSETPSTDEALERMIAVINAEVPEVIGKRNRGVVEGADVVVDASTSAKSECWLDSQEFREAIEACRGAVSADEKLQTRELLQSLIRENVGRIRRC